MATPSCNGAQTTQKYSTGATRADTGAYLVVRVVNRRMTAETRATTRTMRAVRMGDDDREQARFRLGRDDNGIDRGMSQRTWIVTSRHRGLRQKIETVGPL